MTKLYAIYNDEDLPVFVGTSKECATYMGKKTNKSFIDHCTKVRAGIIKPKLRGYVIANNKKEVESDG